MYNLSKSNDLLRFGQFDITAITHRNTILEASNLHYINKHHLMRRMKDSTELLKLAKKVEGLIKQRFPGRFVALCVLRVCV